MQKNLLRVLLVEDLDTDAQVIEGLIRSTDIYQLSVERVRSVEAAIEYLCDHGVEILVLNLELSENRAGESGGLQAIELLHEQAPRASIVALTNSREEITVAAVNAGAQDVICKHRISGDSLVQQLLFAHVRQLKMLDVIDAADIDQLTDLQNRRRFVRSFAAVVNGTTPPQHTLALVDVDRFKLLNDSYGHIGGDTVLRRLAEVLARELSTEHGVYRYGGEEFAVLMNGSVAEANSRLDALLRIVELESIDVGTEQVHVTVSIGVSELKENENYRQAIERCDQALYQAKQFGRNRVVVAKDGEPAASAAY